MTSACELRLTPEETRAGEVWEVGAPAALSREGHTGGFSRACQPEREPRGPKCGDRAKAHRAPSCQVSGLPETVSEDGNCFRGTFLPQLVPDMTSGTNEPYFPVVTLPLRKLTVLLQRRHQPVFVTVVWELSPFQPELRSQALSPGPGPAARPPCRDHSPPPSPNPRFPSLPSTQRL